MREQDRTTSSAESGHGTDVSYGAARQIDGTELLAEEEDTQSHKTVHLRGSEGPCKDIAGADAWETKSVEQNPSARNEIHHVLCNPKFH